MEQDSLDNPVELERFTQVLQQLEGWMEWKTKLMLGVFNAFYMVRYIGYLVAKDGGFFFQSEFGGATVVFFPDPNIPCDLREVDGRTQVILGAIAPGGSALLLTENLEELIELAMQDKNIQ